MVLAMLDLRCHETFMLVGQRSQESQEERTELRNVRGVSVRLSRECRPQVTVEAPGVRHGASHSVVRDVGGTSRGTGVDQLVQPGGNLKGVISWKPGWGSVGHWEALCGKVAWKSARVNKGCHSRPFGYVQAGSF